MRLASYQVHFIDTNHEVGNLEERGDKGMAAGLFLHALRASTRMRAALAVELP
jgi:hypothetical protein